LRRENKPNRGHKPVLEVEEVISGDGSSGPGNGVGGGGPKGHEVLFKELPRELLKKQCLGSLDATDLYEKMFDSEGRQIRVIPRGEVVVWPFRSE